VSKNDIVDDDNGTYFREITVLFNYFEGKTAKKERKRIFLMQMRIHD